MQQNKYNKQNIKVQDLGHYFRSLTSIVDDFSGSPMVTSVLKHFLTATLLNEAIY